MGPDGKIKKDVVDATFASLANTFRALDGIRDEVNRAFSFWDAVVKVVAMLEKEGRVSTITAKEFKLANEWLHFRRL